MTRQKNVLWKKENSNERRTPLPISVCTANGMKGIKKISFQNLENLEKDGLSMAVTTYYS